MIYIAAACLGLLIFLLFLWFIYKCRQKPSHITHYKDVESLQDFRAETIRRSERNVMERLWFIKPFWSDQVAGRLAEVEERQVERGEIWILSAGKEEVISYSGKVNSPLSVRQGGGGGRKVLGDLSNVHLTDTRQPVLLKQSAIFKHIHPTCSSDQVNPANWLWGERENVQEARRISEARDRKYPNERASLTVDNLESLQLTVISFSRIMCLAFTY